MSWGEKFEPGDRVIVVSGKEGEVIADSSFPSGNVSVGLDGRIYSSSIAPQDLEKDPTPRVEQA